MKLFKLMFLILFLQSCVRTESKSTEKSLYVKVAASYELQILAGTIEEIEQNNSYKISKVHFNSVSGGASYLFGLIKYNETDGDAYLRLSLIQDSILKKEFSLNEILELPPVTIDTMEVYVLN